MSEMLVIEIDENKKSSVPESLLRFVSYLKEPLKIRKYFIFIVTLIFVALIISLTVVSTLNGKKSQNTEKLETTLTSTILPQTTTNMVDPFGDGPWQNKFLSDSIIPNIVNLTIRVYPQFNKYEGQIRIEAINTLSENNVVLLNVAANNDLEIEDPQVFLFDKENIQNEPTSIGIQSSFKYKKNEYFVMKLNRPLNVNETIIIDLQFEREFDTNEDNGFFKKQINEIDEEKKTIYITEFYKQNARKVFPCFDEPRFKSVYNIFIEHPSDTLALSSTKKTKEEKIIISPANDFIFESYFQTTFPLSSFQVEWAIIPRNLNFSTINTLNMKNITIYASDFAIQKNQVEFALNVSSKAHNYCKAIKLPTNLVDDDNDFFYFIAIPDLNLKLSESFNLFILDEYDILYSEENNSLEHKRKVAFKVAYAIIQNYIGQLVTGDNWELTWLFESIAKFFTIKFMQEEFPELNIEIIYMTEQMGALWRESFKNEQENLKNIDKIVSLLFSLESQMTTEKFCLNLADFLVAFHFKSIKIEDFNKYFQIHDETTSIENFFNNWLNQSSFPVIRVSFEREIEKKTTIFNFEQSNFDIFWENDSLFSNNSNKTWIVYIECEIFEESNMEKSKTTPLSFFLTEKNKTIQVEDVDATWIKCNKNYHGFYLVDYSYENYDTMTDYLAKNIEILKPIDRAYLINSVFMMAYSGMQSYSLLSVIKKFFLNEKDLFPIKSYIWHLNKRLSTIESKASFVEFIKSGKNVFNSVLSKLDVWNSQENCHLSELELKLTLLDYLCRIKNEICTQNLTKLFESIPIEYFKNPNKYSNNLNANYRLLVYKYYVQDLKTYETWNLLDDFFSKISYSEEKENILLSFSKNQQNWLLKSFLEKILNSADFDKKRLEQALIKSAQNSNGKYFFWSFFQENIETIYKRMNSDDIEKILSNLSEQFDEESFKNQLNSFWINHSQMLNDSIIEDLMTIVNKNILWKNDYERDFLDNIF